MWCSGSEGVPGSISYMWVTCYVPVPRTLWLTVLPFAAWQRNGIYEQAIAILLLFLKTCVDWRRTSPSLIFISASDEEISVKTPAFKMTAALTHACQMLELMAFYLDVNLPKRISYRYCEHIFCTLKILSSIFMKQHWTIYKFICWFIL